MPTAPVLRPDIQALRALAVALVVGAHYWPSVLPGGFVGVDVFFVISGFVITAHLHREASRTGAVRLGAFWARRARRILPAALVTLVVCVVATVALVDLARWPQFLADIRASAAYVQNWHLAATATDYFAAANSPSPVQHFWSLAVEEQFYLLWPVLIGLAIALPARRAGTAAVLGAVTVLSLVWSVTATAADPAAAYFATPARAWEFGAGALLALAPPSAAPAAMRTAARRAGIAAVLCAAVVFGETTAVPGWIVALPVLGTVAAIWASAPTRLMRLRAVQGLGDRSYVVYLWHWPVLILAPYALHHPVGAAGRVVLLAVALAVAAATKVLVEDPVRFGRLLAPRRPRWTFATVAVATGAVLGLAGAASSHEQASLQAAHAETRAVLAAAPACFGAAARDPRHPCHNRRLDRVVVPSPLEAPGLPNGPCERQPYLIGGQKVCSIGADRPTATVMLLGDSHSTHWRAGVDVVARARGWRVLHSGHTSCPFSLAVRPLPEPLHTTCPRWRQGVFQWVREHPAISTIFVSELSGGSGVVPSHGHSAFETAVRGYLAAWARLPRTVKRVIVIRDSPKDLRSTPACVQRAIALHADAGRRCATPRRTVLDTDPAAVAARRLHSRRISVVDLTRYFCDRTRCYPVIGGALVHQDLTHMTATFNATLGPYLLRAVDRIVPRSASRPVRSAARGSR